MPQMTLTRDECRTINRMTREEMTALWARIWQSGYDAAVEALGAKPKSVNMSNAKHGAGDKETNLPGEYPAGDVPHELQDKQPEGAFT